MYIKTSYYDIKNVLRVDDDRKVTFAAAHATECVY